MLFSAVGIDQSHKQNDKVVKTDGSTIGIFDKDRTLLEWALQGPIYLI